MLQNRNQGAYLEKKGERMQPFDVKATVVFLISDSGRICLARKKQAIHHDSGEDIGYSLGMHNGYGGKMEPLDGSITHTALVELAGESRVLAKAEDLDLSLKAYFWKPNKQTGEMMPFMEVSFFFLSEWEGEPQEGKEMGPPEWFNPEDVPYGNMMPADKEILRRMFAGEKGVLEVRLPGKDLPPEISVLNEPLFVPELS
jgi:hypothetical protein